MQTAIVNYFRNHRMAILLAVVFGMLMALPFLFYPFQIGTVYNGIDRIVADDTLYYLARIRDVMDGHYSISNPYYWEHKNGLPNQLFLVEIFLGAIYKTIHLSVFQGFVATTIVASVLAFLLVYAICFQIVHSRVVALAVSALLFIGFSPTYLMRPVSPQMNILFWLSFVLILIIFSKQPHRWKWIGLLALSFGILFYVYPYYWTHGVITFSLIGISYWFIDRLRFGRLATAFICGCIIAIPYIILTVVTFRLPYYSETLERIGIISSHDPSGINILFIVTVVILIGFFAWKKRVFILDYEAVVLGSLLLAVAIAVNQQIITGKNLHFASHYYDLAIFSGVFCLLKIWKSGEEIILRKIGINAFISVFIFVFIAMGFNTYFSMLMNGYVIDASSQRYGEVLRWMNANVPRDSVVLADQSLSSFIPVYTSGNVFFEGNAGLYILSDKEVADRFIIGNMLYVPVTSSFIQTQERAIFGLHYVVVNGHIHQMNLLRGLLRLPMQKIESADGAVINVSQRAQELQSFGFTKAVQDYHLDYIVWDRVKYSNVNPAILNFQRLYEDDDFIVFRFDGD
ncbi:hypothetical protein KJ766_04080 [Patescibacteria group bacterium]|nr:hypothetical protein [Patescibacteria group bacterium]